VERRTSARDHECARHLIVDGKQYVIVIRPRGNLGPGRPRRSPRAWRGTSDGDLLHGANRLSRGAMARGDAGAVQDAEAPSHSSARSFGAGGFVSPRGIARASSGHRGDPCSTRDDRVVIRLAANRRRLFTSSCQASKHATECFSLRPSNVCRRQSFATALLCLSPILPQAAAASTVPTIVSKILAVKFTAGDSRQVRVHVARAQSCTSPSSSRY
jgi:hypothetical protein